MHNYFGNPLTILACRADVHSLHSSQLAIYAKLRALKTLQNMRIITILHANAARNPLTRTANIHKFKFMHTYIWSQTTRRLIGLKNGQNAFGPQWVKSYGNLTFRVIFAL